MRKDIQYYKCVATLHLAMIMYSDEILLLVMTLRIIYLKMITRISRERLFSPFICKETRL